MQVRRFIPRRSRTIPDTAWTNHGSRWRPTASSFVVLVAGLTLFGCGEAALVSSTLGNSPWLVLSEGLSKQTGLTIGTTTFIVSVVVLMGWIPLRERPGLGTVLNAIVIAATVEAALHVLPEPSSFGQQLVMVASGIALVGLGGALYLTCRMGPGPRDGLMTGIHYRSGWPVARVRLILEGSVLSLGWILGGTVGLGTLLFALFIPQALALWLTAVSRTQRPTAAVSTA